MEGLILQPAQQACSKRKAQQAWWNLGVLLVYPWTKSVRDSLAVSCKLRATDAAPLRCGRQARPAPFPGGARAANGRPPGKRAGGQRET